MRNKRDKRKIDIERRKFAGHLQHNGLKLTRGRAQVFEIVMDAHGHFAPEDIVKLCHDQGGHVSRATVYRCIRDMLEAGVIRGTAFGDKHQHYEHLYDEKEHHHARCIRCNTFLEIPDLKEEVVYQPVLEDQGFQILGHEIHFYGICQACQTSQAGEE